MNPELVNEWRALEVDLQGLAIQAHRLPPVQRIKLLAFLAASVRCDVEEQARLVQEDAYA